MSNLNSDDMVFVAFSELLINVLKQVSSFADEFNLNKNFIRRFLICYLSSFYFK